MHFYQLIREYTWCNLAHNNIENAKMNTHMYIRNTMHIILYRNLILQKITTFYKYMTTQVKSSYFEFLFLYRNNNKSIAFHNFYLSRAKIFLFMIYRIQFACVVTHFFVTYVCYYTSKLLWPQYFFYPGTA